MILRRLLLTLALTPVLAFAQANLLTNGSFETGSFGDTNLATGTASIANWSYYDAGNTGGIYYLDNSDSLGLAQDGTRFIFGSGGAEPGNGLYQDFTAVIGQQYTASIYMRYLGTTNDIQGTFLIEDVDNALATVDSLTASVTTGTNSGSSGAGWSLYSFNFTAPSAHLRFTFFDASPSNPSSSADIQFDSASVVSAVPEPSTYAALAGIAALGLVGWQRRRRA